MIDLHKMLRRSYKSMKIGTMTSAFRHGRIDDPYTTYKEQISMCKESGYTILDFNMCAMIDTNTECNKDDWRKQAEEIRTFADDLGVSFCQSHPPYRKSEGGNQNPNPEVENHYCAVTERAIEISSIIGVKWAVLHPATELGRSMLDTEANVQLNHRINDRFANLAQKLDVGIAFENMRDKDTYRRFGSSAEELIALIDSYDSPLIGACWDFGHANRNMGDQERSLRLLGSRLKATHVNDNHGKNLDEHLLPFMGDIDWKQLIPVLRDIQYQGDLIYELSITKNMPMELKMSTMKYASEVGTYLLSL